MNFNGGDIIEDQDYLSEASAYTGGGESIGYLSEYDEIPQMGGGHNSAWEGGYVSDGSLEGGDFIQDGGTGSDAEARGRSSSTSSTNTLSVNNNDEDLIKQYNEKQPRIMEIFKEDDFNSENNNYKDKLIKYLVMKELLLIYDDDEHLNIINNIKNITTITTTDEGEIKIKDIKIEYTNDDGKTIVFETRNKENITSNFIFLKGIKNYTELKKIFEITSSE